VRAKLFWKLGLTYLLLLLAVLAAMDFFASRILRAEFVRSAENELAALEKTAQSRPPQTDDIAALRSWADWMSQSGARVTVIGSDGAVLVDSGEEPPLSENSADLPEVRDAFAKGEAESVRRSPELNRDLAYRAVRYQPPSGSAVVLRMAVPVGEVSGAISVVRSRLVVVSLIILILGGAVSLMLSRGFSMRVERLKDFAGRVAAGDFRPLELEDTEDELADLARALNETAARLAESIRTLTDERNRSSAILRSMAEGVAVIDARERVVFCNQAFAQILSVDAAASEDRPLLEVVRQADLVALARRALQSGEHVQGDLVLGTVSPQNFGVTAAPITALDSQANGRASSSTAQSTGNGAPRPPVPVQQGAVIVLHDISELRRLERVRQDFVANVSHEFKTPLTAIQGFAETLLTGALEDEKNNRRFLEIIRDHAVRLGRLTDDLLKLARIEAGKLELEFHRVDIADIIESCATTTLMRASRRNLSLDVSFPPALPAVRGDSSLLREVLQNLLDNAVQYTQPGGKITLSANAGDSEAIVTVADTGIGIPQAEKERIFERFYRVDAARSREVGGTGLGLSIAKHIVEAHGGRIWVDSSVGQGSQFHFSIPLAT
jgi:two-component system, OmpR family, phosphate regulon sensor histidine kinase PhoR